MRRKRSAARAQALFFIFRKKKLGSISIVGARRARSGARAQALLAHTGCARARDSEESRATPGELSRAQARMAHTSAPVVPIFFGIFFKKIITIL